MSKYFIKNQKTFISSKKSIYIKLALLFLLFLTASLAFIFYSNFFILENLKDSYNENIKLHNKIKLLNSRLNIKDSYIVNLEKDNEELTSSFNQYVDSMKFKIAAAEEIKNKLYQKEVDNLELNREINYYKLLSSVNNKNNLISIDEFSVNLSDSKNYLDYSFLLLSNQSNLNIKGKYNLYYKKKSDNKDKKREFKLKNNNIKFKNYIKVTGKVKISEYNELYAIYLDFKYNGNIYKHIHIVN